MKASSCVSVQTRHACELLGWK